MCFCSTTLCISYLANICCKCVHFILSRQLKYFDYHFLNAIIVCYIVVCNDFTSRIKGLELLSIVKTL